MTKEQAIDFLERAYNAGCFDEVLKLIRADSDPVMIDKVIEKSKLKDALDGLWMDIFGSD